MLTESEVIDQLRAAIAATNLNSGDYARIVLGVSPAFLSAVLSGHKRPSGVILDALGLVKTVGYVEIRSALDAARQPGRGECE